MAIATNMLFGLVIASCVVGGLGQLYLYYNSKFDTSICKMNE